MMGDLYVLYVVVWVEVERWNFSVFAEQKKDDSGSWIACFYTQRLCITYQAKAGSSSQKLMT
jgi:hypothetical protein